ncbi:MAG: HD domain-containing protein [Betaproteobacteria bacterium]|nr:HD domain-containing protein [Betaproteobacteria bacterium]
MDRPITQAPFIDSRDTDQSKHDLYRFYRRQNIANAYRMIDQIASQYTVDEAASLNAETVEAIEIMALIGELHDDDTGAHVYRVGAMTRLIALELGHDEQTAAHLDIAARLHDIGKVGIHPDIMQKPGSLTFAERTIMMEHAAIGADILMRMSHPLMVIAAQIAGNHHERWDGEGYPAGRTGEGIPLAARITSVADVFDALTHARVYKYAWRTDEAVAEIKRGRGSAFDPAVVDAFLVVVERLVAARGEGNDAREYSAEEYGAFPLGLKQPVVGAPQAMPRNLKARIPIVEWAGLDRLSHKVVLCEIDKNIRFDDFGLVAFMIGGRVCFSTNCEVMDRFFAANVTITGPALSDGDRVLVERECLINKDFQHYVLLGVYLVLKAQFGVTNTTAEEAIAISGYPHTEVARRIASELL